MVIDDTLISKNSALQRRIRIDVDGQSACSVFSLLIQILFSISLLEANFCSAMFSVEI